MQDKTYKQQESMTILVGVRTCTQNEIPITFYTKKCMRMTLSELKKFEVPYSFPKED